MAPPPLQTSGLSRCDGGAGAEKSFTVTFGVTYGKLTGTVTDQGEGVAGTVLEWSDCLRYSTGK